MSRSILLAVPFFCITAAHAQRGESDLNIFGYFQVSLTHQATTDGDEKDNTFNIQQLNLFLQKDLGKRWTSLVNFELVNNFSSDKF
ncbi:MAG: hypothetical protein OEN01_14875, partial [Candidatus Krumholzibacteria bacterium]|nr:hypothetical protein [Candidatus Krumholzibacteria bacterium]